MLFKAVGKNEIHFTLHFFHFSLYDGLKMRLAIVGKTTLKRGKKTASLNYEYLLARERHSLICHLAKCWLVLSLFPLTTACQLNIAVQDIQDAFAYAIHEIFLTIRNNWFTQSRFGCK